MTKADQALLARLARKIGRDDGSGRPATQRAVADEIRVSDSTVSDVVSGRRDLSVEVRKRARAALDRLTVVRR